jgi:hypothetical protein
VFNLNALSCLESTNGSISKRPTNFTVESQSALRSEQRMPISSLAAYLRGVFETLITIVTQLRSPAIVPWPMTPSGVSGARLDACKASTLNSLMGSVGCSLLARVPGAAR